MGKNAGEGTRVGEEIGNCEGDGREEEEEVLEELLVFLLRITGV